MMLVVAYSGGKDSTALAYELSRRGEPFSLLFTPTGNELPGVVERTHQIAEDIGADLILPPAPTLDSLIRGYNALPNFRQRWCTRKIKIEPCIAWLQAHPGSVLAVGLRADEERRRGLFGDVVTYRYPLREWQWGLTEVMAATSDVCIPRRTDCALCFFQRVSEWERLWLEHPEEYERGIAYEEMTGHTWRTPGRDAWPTSLRDLRAAFDAGLLPRGTARQVEMFQDQCRVCSL